MKNKLIDLTFTSMFVNTSSEPIVIEDDSDLDSDLDSDSDSVFDLENETEEFDDSMESMESEDWREIEHLIANGLAPEILEKIETLIETFVQ